MEEERENELEQLFEAGMEKAQQTAEAEEEEAEAMGREGGLAEASSAGRRNIDSVKGAERLLEAMKVRKPCNSADHDHNRTTRRTNGYH